MKKGKRKTTVFTVITGREPLCMEPQGQNANFTLGPGALPMTATRSVLPQPPNAPVSTSRSEIDFQANIIGVPVSAIALIDLIQKIFDIGLAPVFAEFIEMWRHATAPLVHLLSAVLPFRVPQGYCDLFIVSFVLASLYFKSLPVSGGKIVDFAINWIFSFGFSLVMAGYLMLLISLDGAKKPRGSQEREAAMRHLNSVFQVVCLTLVFYIANSKL